MDMVKITHFKIIWGSLYACLQGKDYPLQNHLKFFSFRKFPPPSFQCEKNIKNCRLSQANFNKALAQSMNTAQALCRCVSPPESDQTAEIRYPLRLPASTEFPSEFPGAKHWEDIRSKCEWDIAIHCWHAEMLAVWQAGWSFLNSIFTRSFSKEKDTSTWEKWSDTSSW